MFKFKSLQEKKSCESADCSNEIQGMLDNLISRGSYRNDKHHVAGIFVSGKDRKLRKD